MFVKRATIWLIQGGVAYGQFLYLYNWMISDDNPQIGQFFLKLAICYLIPAISMLILLLIFKATAKQVVNHAYWTTVLFPAIATLTAFALYVKSNGHFFFALFALVLFALVYAIAGLLIPFILASLFGFEHEAIHTGHSSDPTSENDPVVPGTGGYNGTSEEKTDFWGDPYIEHRNEKGEVIGKSVKRTDFWGDEYIEHTDKNGYPIGKTVERKDFWGDDYAQHTDKNGTVIGTSSTRTDFWGDEYVQHKNKDGTEAGRSEVRTDFWGDNYIEHTKK